MADTGTDTSAKEWMKEAIKGLSDNCTVKNLAELVIQGVDIAVQNRCMLLADKSFKTVDQIINNVCNDMADNSCCLNLIDKIPLSGFKNKCSQILNIFFGKNQNLTEDVKKEIVNALNAAKSEMADQIIQLGAMASVVIIAVQFVNLCLTWKKIREAGNINKESKNSFGQIEKKIEELEKDAVKLIELMINYKETEDDQTTTKIARKIGCLTMRMNATYVETVLLISDVKAKIEGCYQRIDLLKNRSVLDATSTATQGITYLVSFFRFGSLLSTPVRVIQGVVTGAMFTLSAAHVYMYALSKQELEKLRESMKEIEKFDKMLKEIREKMNKAEAWYQQLDEN